MKVLMISTDRSILITGSEAHARMLEYGALVEELHIIIFSRGQDAQEHAGNVFLYPTNSKNKLKYIFDAVRIAKTISHFDIVTTQDSFETGLAGWLIAQRNNTALQLQIHADFLSPYFARESLLNRIRVLIAKFLLPRASGIRVVSERIKNSLKAKSYKLQAEPTVLPIFVDTEQLKNAPVTLDLHKKHSQFDFIIFMASRLTKEKNIPLAIEAFAEAVRKHPRMGLVIVGDGPERKNLEREIAVRILQSNVVLKRWEGLMASCYKTADVFLLTSNYEGYGRTVVEAQACGLPVVMTDVGVAGDFIVNKENGLVVPVGDAHALADAIVRVKEKKAALKARVFHQEKSEYLRAYRRAWEACGSRD